MPINIEDTTVLLNKLLDDLNHAMSNPDFKKQDLRQFYPAMERLKKNEHNEQALLHTQPDKAENNLCLLMDLLFSAIEKKKNDIADFILNSLLSQDCLSLKSDWFLMHTAALKKLLQALDAAVKIEEVETVQNLLQTCDILFLQNNRDHPQSFLRTVAASDLEYTQMLDRFIYGLFIFCSNGVSQSHCVLCIKFLNYFSDHQNIIKMNAGTLLPLLALLENPSKKSRATKLAFEDFLSLAVNNKENYPSLFEILYNPVIKNLDYISNFISNIISHDVLPKMDKIELYPFLNERSQYSENHTRWACLIDSLYVAARCNNQCEINGLVQVLLECITKLDKIALSRLLFEKIELGFFAEKNTLFLLLLALSHLARINPSAMNSIAKLIQHCLDKCDVEPSRLAMTLAEKPSHELPNLLFSLMLTFIFAIYDKDDEGTLNCLKLIRFCFDTRNVDATLFATAMSDKVIIGVFAENNALRLLSELLRAAAYPSILHPIENICTLMRTGIEKYIDASALVKALTGADSDGENIWFILIDALNSALIKKNNKAVGEITRLIHELLEKYHNDTPALIAALIEKHTAGQFNGMNALYSLFQALYVVAIYEDKQLIQSTVTLVHTLLNTFKDHSKIFVAALNAKKAADPDAKKNAFYYLVVGLTIATYKGNNSAAINDIFNLVCEWLEKYSADVTALVATLKERVTEGHYKWKNALSIFVDVLYRGVDNNDKNAIKNVSKLMHLCLAKLDTSSLLGFDDYVGKGMQKKDNEWSLLRNALNRAQTTLLNDNQSRAYLFSCILDILAIKEKTPWFPAYDFFEERGILMAHFIGDYFAKKVKQIGLLAMEAACSGETMLGNLIDHHSSGLSFGNTSTRNFVSDFIGNEKEKMARAASQGILPSQFFHQAQNSAPAAAAAAVASGDDSEHKRLLL